MKLLLDENLSDRMAAGMSRTQRLAREVVEKTKREIPDQPRGIYALRAVRSTLVTSKDER
jgi:hypothetical protein